MLNICGLFYGKSAIGLGESLNIPATTKDLLLKYSKETEDYINSNRVEYKSYCDTYYKGRQSNSSMHEFLKKMHKEGSFLGDITTADDLIDRFYGTFPNIYSYLSQCADQAVKEFKIVTPDVFQRIRKFAYTEDQGELNAIKRAAMNFPIQGSSASMTKYAICLMKKYIEEYNLQDRLKFALPIHDEIIYLCREDFAEEGLKILTEKMEEAAEVVLNNKLLKAEGKISLVWEK